MTLLSGISHRRIGHCAAGAVGLAMSSLVGCALLANDKEEVNPSARSASSTYTLPGRIYVATTRIPPNDGTIEETTSFDPNTGNLRVEAVPRGYARWLRISPDGKTSAYWRGGDRDEAFACPLDGSSAQVSLMSDYGGWSLTWAPDGKRLIATTCAYKAVNNQAVLRMQAWLLNADGSGKERLPIPDTHLVLDWSANGKFLLTWVPPRTQPRAATPRFPDVLYVMRPDGSDVRRVSPEGMGSWYGRISPDSCRIAYQAYEEAANWSNPSAKLSVPRRTVSIMTSAGTDCGAVIRSDDVGVPSHMCWSPDGKYLAIEVHKMTKTWLGGWSFPRESRIDICDLKGKRVRTLTAPEDGSFSQSASIDWR